MRSWRNKSIINEICEELNIQLIKISNDDPIDHTKFEGIYEPKNTKHQELKTIIEEKGGTLVSKKYVDTYETLLSNVKRITYLELVTTVSNWCGGGKIKCSIEKLNETLECENIQCMADDFPGVGYENNVSM